MERGIDGSRGTHIWLDGCMDRWMNGWMNKWMDGYFDSCNAREI